ncbi:MAG: hypothetical protein WAO20_12845, partial [Acidobacteriota bacterium]
MSKSTHRTLLSAALLLALSVVPPPLSRPVLRQRPFLPAVLDAANPGIVESVPGVSRSVTYLRTSLRLLSVSYLLRA